MVQNPESAWEGRSEHSVIVNTLAYILSAPIFDFIILFHTTSLQLMTANATLADEVEAVNSIYNADTLVVTNSENVSTLSTLNLPDSPFSFNLTFPRDYPDVPPQLDGIQSTGSNTKKGDGEAALNILRDVLSHTFTPGQVCLFDLIEEVTPLLHQQTTPDVPTVDDGPAQDLSTAITNRSAMTTPTSAPSSIPISELSNLHVKDLASDSSLASSLPEPAWTLSQPLLNSRSTFVARALKVNSLAEATTAIGHLIATNKRVATATHNITAWRIKSQASAGAPEIVVQDCDDDGETAAGGRVLHLMQLMDVWNVVVVVTRWYGGVKLGPDRFRCINSVARDALVLGGFAKEDTGNGGKAKGKKK